MQEKDKEPLQERFFRPHFLQAPGDMVAHEGRLCRLDCKVGPSAVCGSSSVHVLQLFVCFHLFCFCFCFVGDFQGKED